jgi:vacuolar-type H+-ATPase subunit H
MLQIRKEIPPNPVWRDGTVAVRSLKFHGIRDISDADLLIDAYVALAQEVPGKPLSMSDSDRSFVTAFVSNGSQASELAADFASQLRGAVSVAQTRNVALSNTPDGHTFVTIDVGKLWHVKEPGLDLGHDDVAGASDAAPRMFAQGEDFIENAVQKILKETATPARDAETERETLAVLAKLQKTLEAEIDRLTEEYRRYLREAATRGEDPAVAEALERARLQESILKDVPMVDQRQACELLGLSTRNASATMARREDDTLHFRIDGKMKYPLLQFDVEARQIYPALRDILDLAREAGWSNFRLLNWLLRPHMDFDTVPADALGRADAEVMAALRRAIRPDMHG